MINKNDIKNLILQLNNIEITDWWWIFEVFRKNIQSIFKSKYVVLTNNWTSALYLAYKAIWLSKDDEVITWTYTYHSTNSTLLHFTKKIIFCDIDENITISIKQIKEKISQKTKLLIIPYTWWLSPNMNEIIKLKEKYKNLKIIEDCSQAHFWKYNNKYLWTFWDIWVFSMQWGKLLPAWEWWFAITNDKYFYETMLVNSDSWKTLENLLHKDSLYKKYIETWLWFFKFRPNPLWIALANSKLENIKEKQQVRNYFMKLIKDSLRDINSIKFIDIKNYINPWYAIIWIYENNEVPLNIIIKKIQNSNIYEIYNPKNNKPNHLLEVFSSYKDLNLKYSEFIYSNILVFKLYDEIEYKDKIIEYINKFKIIIKEYNVE